MASFTSWLPAILTAVGGGGLAWILKFQREDAGKAVEQVDAAMAILRLLNDDLLETVKRLSKERDHAREALENCEKMGRELSQRLRALEQRDGKH